MRQIVSNKTDEISPHQASQYKPIYAKCIGNIYAEHISGIYKLHRVGTDSWAFVTMDNSSYWGFDKQGSLLAAIEKALDNNATVYQFESVQEAARWLLDNS